MNEAIKYHLCTEYNRLAATHFYVYGIVKNGLVLAYTVTKSGAESLMSLATLDRASSKNGGTYSIKFKPNKEQKAILEAIADEVKVVCTEDYLEAEFASRRQNRGQIFEELVAKMMGGKQATKKNAKFTECGDIEVGGIQYQVKYNKATYTDERTLQRLA